MHIPHTLRNIHAETDGRYPKTKILYGPDEWHWLKLRNVWNPTKAAETGGFTPGGMMLPNALRILLAFTVTNKQTFFDTNVNNG